MSLSERIRPGVEAAPWVIEEIKKLEARIKASQEQEPVATKLPSNPCDERTGFWFSLADIEKLESLPSGAKLYSAPVIPPDVAELQRRIIELEQAAQDEINRIEEQKLDLSKLLEENRILLEEAKSKALQEGLKLVPKEPTAEMIEAGNDGFRNPDSRRHTVSSCYKAMLAAAPQPGGSNE